MINFQIFYLVFLGVAAAAISVLILLFFNSKKDSKRKEIELNNKIKDLEKRGRLTLEYLSIAAHQLRAPLASMKWALELLVQKENSDENKQKLSEILKFNENLAVIINDLLSVSKMEAGALSIKLQPANFENLILEEITILKPHADFKGIEIAFQKDEEIKEIMLDPKIFSEAFKNILDNAITYAPKDSKVRVFSDKKENEYVISVHNDGPAIDGQEQSKIFTKFYRGEAAKELRPEGSGLGLFIAKSAIEAMGGKIWFQSPAHENIGAIFYISVPIASIDSRNQYIGFGNQ